VAVASAGLYASLHLILDNDANITPLSFLQAGCPSCHPTNSVNKLTKILHRERYLFHRKNVLNQPAELILTKTKHRPLQLRYLAKVSTASLL